MVGAERLLPIVIVGFKANLEKVPPFSKRCSIFVAHTKSRGALLFLPIRALSYQAGYAEELRLGGVTKKGTAGLGLSLEKLHPSTMVITRPVPG